MRVSEAFNIAKHSIDSLKSKLEELGIKDLYELTDNLRFTDNREVFQISHEVLMKKLLQFTNVIKNFEENAEDRDSIEEIIYHIREKTGFHIPFETSPSARLRGYIDEIHNWKEKGINGKRT